MYKALYSKYRPLTFEDVVSQEHITKTLKNQILNNKTAHAYLFTGSRGTGKTTCARILAKAVNCLSPKDGNPCLECEICRDADNSAIADIIEIDAASNTGVDDMRDLRDGAVYTPERCRYKVYIIDEVHMLSQSAFNSLLKIMEEPPEHVKFILATTEIHKVLPTILSRCQRFDFRRILPADIKNRLLYVAGQENISLEEDAAELIARTADGGMRDALSMLDRCIAFSEHITSDTVADAAGIAGREYLFEIISAAVDKDPSRAITVIKRLYELSKDMQRLCDELIAQFRNIMLAKTVPQNTDVLVCMPSEIAMIQDIASKMTLEDIFAKLDILQSCSERMPRASAKRVEIEMCMIRLCSASAPVSADNSELYARIDTLERRLASAGAQPMAAVPQKSYSEPPAAVRPAPQRAQDKPSAAPQASDGGKPDMSNIRPVARWAEILELFSKSCPSVSGTLEGSSAFESSDYMFISTNSRLFMNLLRDKENAAKLSEAVSKVTGRLYKIRAKCTEESGGQETESPLQALLKKAADSGIPTETN